MLSISIHEALASLDQIPGKPGMYRPISIHEALASLDGFKSSHTTDLYSFQSTRLLQASTYNIRCNFLQILQFQSTRLLQASTCSM